MALRDLMDIIGPLTLPIRGKEYALPMVSLAEGLKLHAAASDGGTLPLSELITMILGDAQAEMEADGVPAALIDRALWTGVTDFQAGRETAELVWEHGVPKEALAKILGTIQEAMNTQQAEATTAPKARGDKASKQNRGPRPKVATPSVQ